MFLAFCATGFDVVAQSCGGVLDAIEEGDDILAEVLVQSYVSALLRKMPNPQAAILGCAHYLFMQDIFQDAFGPSVKVFSRASLVAESLADYLVCHPNMKQSGQMSKFITTRDAVQFYVKASKFLRREITYDPI